MKINLRLLIIIAFNIVFLQLSGQSQIPDSTIIEKIEIGKWYISGTVKDYQTNENLHFINVVAHTSDPWCSFLSLLPPESATTDQDGFFRIKIHGWKSINLTFFFIGCSPLSIMNIQACGYNNEISLKHIFFKSSPWFYNDFNFPDRKERRQIKSEKKEGSNTENSTGLGWGGIPNEYIDKHSGMERITLNYPENGSKKKFLYYKSALIIDFSEFMKNNIQ